MSFQIANNNTFTIAPTSPNPYISRKLNNMDQAQVMKKEREDWKRTYHKTLKGLEAMIYVQRIMKNMKKLAEETSMTVTEIKGTILTASINNQTTNAMNITWMTEHFKSRECWPMNLIDTKKKGIDIWKKIFKRSRSYILRRKTEEKKE